MKTSAFLPMTPQRVGVLEYLIKVLGSFIQGILPRLGLIMYFAFFLNESEKLGGGLWKGPVFL